MTNKMVKKDEREVFIENVSYKFGYNFVTFALLLDVVYRGLRFNEAPWETSGTDRAALLQQWLVMFFSISISKKSQGNLG